MFSSLQIFAQKDTTFKGTIEEASLSTHNIKYRERIRLNKDINYFVSNMGLISSYYEKTKLGDTVSAKKITDEDTIIFPKSGAGYFGFVMLTYFAQMRQWGVLYKPCILLEDGSPEAKIIFCTAKQMKVLTKNKEKVYQVDCKFIGNSLEEATPADQLKSYK